MKGYRKVIFLWITMLFSPIFAVAQNTRLTIGFSANYSMISDLHGKVESNIPTPSYYKDYVSTNENYNGKSGGKIFSSLEIDLPGHFYSETGLGFNLLRYERKMTLNHVGNSGSTIPDTSWIFHVGYPTTPFFPYPDTGYLSIVYPDSYSWPDKITVIYMDIPLKVGYKLLKDKLRVNAGIVASVLVFSYHYYFNFETNMRENKTGCKDLNSLLLNSEFGLSYQFTKKIAVTGNYTRSLTPIYQSDYRLVGKAKYQYFSVGVTYNIGSLKLIRSFAKK